MPGELWEIIYKGQFPGFDYFFRCVRFHIELNISCIKKNEDLCTPLSLGTHSFLRNFCKKQYFVTDIEMTPCVYEQETYGTTAL